MTGACAGCSARVTTALSLTRTGSGEPLLLLHGLGSSRRDFTAALPALTDRFEVINVDLPGIGRSPHLERRPTVAAITDSVEHTLDAEGLGCVHEKLDPSRHGRRATFTDAARVSARGVCLDDSRLGTKCVADQQIRNTNSIYSNSVYLSHLRAQSRCRATD
jgi:hypothetical protein